MNSSLPPKAVIKVIFGMGRLGVPDRYVDAFCGRAPKSVLARRYSDFAPGKLKEIYERTNLKILNMD